jgi:predicted nucleic acid-binding protein
LDAVHLASALVCAADLLITYDRRLAQAARELGVRVEHPGVAPER